MPRPGSRPRRFPALLAGPAVAFAVLLAACQTSMARRAAVPAMENAVRTVAAAEAPARVMVAYADLRGGGEFEIDATRVVHAASTMKVPVMIELFRRHDAGTLDLDAPMILRNEFRSIVDGSNYALDPADDSDPELYEHVGQPVVVRELLHRMIARSSNLATNRLIELVGADAVQATCEELGAVHGLRVLRGVEDQKAYDAGLSNVTTARDLAILLRAIATGRAASSDSCEQMLRILLEQEFAAGIPAGLPDGTAVAHKTGSISGIRHDAAIVDPFGPSPWVLVVLTADIFDGDQADRAIADIARTVHERRSRRGDADESADSAESTPDR